MEQAYFHSVTLDKEKCKGCTNCIKHCPTEAIRVRGGKAAIIAERCVDCGECIRICPYHAKKAVTDSLERLKDYTVRIALPAPSLYGQFGPSFSRSRILQGLLSLGFDGVYEVAAAAEIVTRATDRYMRQAALKKPVISSACPAVVRLIQVRFPNLIDNLAKIDSPMEVAARLAREAFLAEKGEAASKERVGVFFISPCAAKVTSVKAPYESYVSSVSGVLAMKEVYLPLLEAMKAGKSDKTLMQTLSGPSGIGWAGTGGESSALSGGRRIAVHGIKNVIDILDMAVQGALDSIDFIEALACPEGCLGGPLTVENPFISKINLKYVSEDAVSNKGKAEQTLLPEEDKDYIWKSQVTYRPILKLDEDMLRAIEKMQHMDELTDSLPGLDCGACGAPNCRALAEDIVRENARVTDCIFKLRERVSDIASLLQKIEEP